MVNTKHDATSYESCSGYQREIFNGNALYDAYVNAKKGSDWKPQVQRFEMTYLLELARIQKDLKLKQYKFLPPSEFILHERGKTRYVSGEQIPDRIVKHSLCDEVLSPNIRKYLIYDNGAGLTDRGLDFTRRRVMTHLRKYYAEHGSNEGYILLIDFSKYYDNLRHDEIMKMFRKYIKDEYALWLLEVILENSRVDVSYMSDEEYSNCMNVLFNSLEYARIDKSLLTGEKFMDKHMNIGDQVAQVVGILYPAPIDNYIKIVRGVKYYSRSSDDSYVIHHDKAFLEDLLENIIQIASSIGITVNTKKTRICKLSEYWRFLQIQYSLTDTGRVIHKINPERLTGIRRKMKKLVYIYSPIEFENWYKSWFKNHYKHMSKLQRQNLDELFAQLKEVNKNVYNDSCKRNQAGKPGTERQ